MKSPSFFGRKLWVVSIDIGWSTAKGLHFIVDIRFFVKEEDEEG